KQKNIIFRDVCIVFIERDLEITEQDAIDILKGLFEGLKEERQHC
ncbi:MAG: hypothetical protein PWP27_1093, partial [Clostridiales bacterium]|nr:hypothetical protein [Clostridiales bacterium]